MLGLRLQEGLDLATLRQRFGPARVEQALRRLDPYFEKGWASCEGGRLRLIPPEGWLFSNEVIAELFP